jgi:chaperonin GroEL (HSP60 family)
MAAELATVNNRILARMKDERAMREAKKRIPRTAGAKSQLRGMQLDCGYLSPYFITDPERMEVAFEDVYILIHEGEIGSMKDLLPLLEQITEIGKPLLIIAEDVGGGALATLVVNKLRGPLRVAAVRAPGFGEQRKRMLRELAILTGGKSIAEGSDMPPANIQISDLGRARKITINRNHTVVEGNVKYDRSFFETAPRTQANAYASPVQSAQSHAQGTNGGAYAAARP